MPDEMEEKEQTTEEQNDELIPETEMETTPETAPTDSDAETATAEAESATAASTSTPDENEEEQVEKEEQEQTDSNQPEFQSVNVDKAQFESLDPSTKTSNETLKLNLLLDISVNVAIELGRTQMLIKDVLNLGVGSIVELNKLAGEPVDLLVNEKKFAEGEVVVIDENFGIRLTSLVNPDTRVEQIPNAMP